MKRRSGARWLGLGARLSIGIALLQGLLAGAGDSTVQAAGGVSIEGFPVVEQSYSLSCEYASAAAVTRFWGRLVTEQDFMHAIAASPDPHLGFRGNINGVWGGINNYGIYAEPLVAVLEANGYQARVFYDGVARLKSEVAGGHPVVIWYAGMSGDLPVTYERYRGQTFKLVPYEHASVVYGYDRGGVWVMNVGLGMPRYYNWSDFLQRWSYFDKMALVITPG